MALVKWILLHTGILLAALCFLFITNYADAEEGFYVDAGLAYLVESDYVKSEGYLSQCDQFPKTRELDDWFGILKLGYRWDNDISVWAEHGSMIFVKDKGVNFIGISRHWDWFK